jgi:hypothetical protein
VEDAIGRAAARLKEGVKDEERKADLSHVSAPRVER